MLCLEYLDLILEKFFGINSLGRNDRRELQVFLARAVGAYSVREGLVSHCMLLLIHFVDSLVTFRTDSHCARSFRFILAKIKNPEKIIYWNL